ASETRAVHMQLAVLATLAIGFAAITWWFAPGGFRWIGPIGLGGVLITERLGNSFGRMTRGHTSAAEPVLVAIAAVGLFVWPFANRETPHAVTLLCLA